MITCPRCNSNKMAKSGKAPNDKQRFKCGDCGLRTVRVLNTVSKEIPEGYVVKGQSTLYDELGNVKLTWEKTDRKWSEHREAIKQAIEALCQKIEPADPQLRLTEKVTEEHLTVYPFGDPHVGLHAWHEETGEDYDLKKAEQIFTSAMVRAVQKASPSKEAVIVNVGDFFHADNMDNRTRRSGNALDVDSRFQKIARIGIQILRLCITEALKKHETVRVINAIGNHDEHSSQWLSIALQCLYENEPRVFVLPNANQFQYLPFGKCLIGVTHGDTVKPADLGEIMATDQPELWGASKFRYWYTGHVHHDQIKEFRGCKFESFRTLAAKDAWHSASGYRSDRDLKVITLHRDYGEVERATISIEQLREVA